MDVKGTAMEFVVVVSGLLAACAKGKGFPLLLSLATSFSAGGS